MKQIIFIVIMLLGLSLAGCASTTRTQNTTIGAITGAAVGGLASNGLSNGNGHGPGVIIGVVVGALIGGFIGHYIDSSDYSKNYPIVANNPYAKRGTWEDPKTHILYDLTPKSNLYTIKGNPNCRDFHFSSKMYHQEFDGTACIQLDGQWQRVSKSKF